MRKILILVFAVVLLFNTAVFAEDSAVNSGKEAIAVFSAAPEFTNDTITVKLPTAAEGSAPSFSVNPDTGFICANGDKYTAFIKELDDNIEVVEETLVINRTEEIDLYLQYRFNAYIFIFRQEDLADSIGSALEPQLFQAGKDAEALMAEVTVDFTDGKAQFTVRKTGTSTGSIDSGNVDKLLGNNLLLVNRSNALDRSYFPADMIYSKPSRGRAAVNIRLNREAMKQLNYMLDAAYQDGVSGMVITSAFRTFEKQTSLYNDKTSMLSRKMNRRTAMEEASKVVAIPGSSEHQTGLAADICSEGTGLISSFGNTRQGKWLKDNSWKFGYIIRYPKDKTQITGIIYEPWHVRYVGSIHAEIMTSNSLCLEEYVEYLRKNSVISFTDSNGSNYAIQYIDKESFAEAGMTLNLAETSAWSISNCTKDSYILTIKL